tara:strand:- start:3494 stop:4711 length:1218 start_codon:yes stop_codon:yes gene_type:complete
MKDISSNRINSINPSSTVSLSSKAKRYKNEGRDVINVTTGELPFQTPKYIRESLYDAIELAKDKYSDPSGILELKEAIVDKFGTENNLRFRTEEIVIGSGVKELFFNIMASTISKNDEVIIPVPYWVSFPEIVKLFDGKPVYIESDNKNNFKINPDQLRSVINERTKWLIINSPSNPTGSVYTASELKEIADVLRESKNKHVLVISDDIYEKIIFDNNSFNNILNVAPDLENRVVIMNGFSKSFCMTGWRLGYAAAKKGFIDLISIIKSHSTTCTPPFIQYAGAAALKGDNSFIDDNLKEIEKCRDAIVKGLNSIKGISCTNPDGSFYVFPSCKRLINSKTPDGKLIKSSKDFASYLLEDYNLAVIPGEAFGLDNYFRISYTIENRTMEELLRRLRKACSKLLVE